ncbi:MAG: DAK2 domain-containing protein [Bacteroidales bacterium]|nr:DAK2 domain-containing protein [Bacteroidales bacterium]
MSQIIDSTLYSDMLRQGAASLYKDKTVVNDLNVFPIPDGDTGDNMYMTLKAGAGEAGGKPGTLSQTAHNAAQGMLLGARGNSGVILSRIFAGLAKGLEGLEEADAAAFARAMSAAVKEAYGAIPVPVEGTIITVLREGTEGASGRSLEEYFDTLLEAMQISLDHTPEKLEVLRQAGVVDSGGAGLLCIFRGMNEALHGISQAEESAIETAPQAATVDLSRFTEDTQLEFGYCTEFLLRLTRAKTNLDTFDIKELTGWLEANGESVVAFRDGSIVKVHVHTFTPGHILNHCQQYGEFLTLKIENMTLQHHQESNQNNASFKRPKLNYGIVTVAAGEGLTAAFKEGGADVVIPGGQTMNPSTRDFIRAFDQIYSDHILVFPNNSNIKMAAEQAAGMYTKASVRVIPSTTIGEGYYAIAAADRDCTDIDQVISDISQVMESVDTGMISRAIRDADGEGVNVVKGDFVGYQGKSILADSPCRAEAAAALLDKMGAGSRDVLLAFIGEDVDETEAEQLQSGLSTKYPMLEIMFNRGGQPIYDYIFVLC